MEIQTLVVMRWQGSSLPSPDSYDDQEVGQTHPEVGPSLQSTSPEGEQSQADVGNMVYECCVGHADLERHYCHLLAPGLPPVRGELPRLAPFQYDRGISKHKFQPHVIL